MRLFDKFKNKNTKITFIENAGGVIITKSIYQGTSKLKWLFREESGTPTACFITQKSAADFLKALQKLSIPVRNWKSETFGFSFSLTTFEEYQLREELPEEMNIHFIRNQSAPYKLVVPRKGRAYRLDEAALVACKEAILAEAGEKAVFRDGKLYVNESVDSRHLGFVPRDHIIGNAWLCWFSRDKQRIFKPVN